MKERILIVDDEEAILFAVSEYFGTLGYEVACARDKAEAEALLSESHYDLLIADLRLSGFGGAEGLEIVSFVRSREPRTPVVLLTAYGSPEVEREAALRGVDVLLQKPTPLPDLARITRALIDKEASA